MSCVRGCCDTQREHYRSVGTLSAERASMTRTTAVQAEDGRIAGKTIEHFDGRQDATVFAPEPIRLKTTVENVG